MSCFASLTLIAITFSFLSGCGSLPGAYRDFNRERSVLPVVEGQAEINKVDLYAMIDPLGLGRELVAERMREIGKSERAAGSNVGDTPVSALDFYNRGEGAEFDFVGADFYANALLGFRDPRYPELLCGKSVTAGQGIDPGRLAAAQGVCRGETGSGSNKGSGITESVVETVRRTTVTRKTRGRDGRYVAAGKPKTEETVTNVAVTVKARGTGEAPLQVFQRLRRNRIQDRLIHASVLACSEYTANVRLLRSDANAAFALAGLALGGAGAIIEGASQALSAAAGGLAGASAATDKSYYNELAVDVILKGIEAARAKKLAEIRAAQVDPIDKYSLNSAIGAAAEYHAACSIEAGLTTAGKASDKEKEAAEKKTKEKEEEKQSS